MTAGVSVGSLLGIRGANGLDLDLLAGASGLERRITLPYIQKTGLALAGFNGTFKSGRVLIFGESEIRFLEQLNSNARVQTLTRLFDRDLPCVLVTAGLQTPVELEGAAERASVPLFRTTLPTATAIGRLIATLEERMAPHEMRHGVLLDILGLGVLIVGESGIGKSECALDLVGRGHRLVADDTVDVRLRGDSILIGSCPELTRHHIEIRGIGLINVTDLFGVAATRSSKRVEMVVQLERWDTDREYDRLGLDTPTIDVLGVSVPLVTMPVAPGRNVAMLVEVAARNHILRTRGRHAAQLLAQRLEHRLSQAEPDFELDSEAGDL